MYYVNGVWFEGITEAIDDAQWLLLVLRTTHDVQRIAVYNTALFVVCHVHEDQILWFDDKLEKEYDDFING